MIFPSPLPGEGPTTATKTAPPARGWAAGSLCVFVRDLCGIQKFTQNTANLMSCRENSRNSGVIWLKFVDNQLRFQQNFVNLQKLKFANFERFLNFNTKFPNVQMALSTGLCRSRQALFNAYLVVKIGFDTAENEPPKV